MNVYWELSHSSEANSSQKNQRGKIAIWRYDEQRVLFAPAAASDARHIGPPQRYGRPYTLTENPQLLLQIKAQNQVRYFHPYDLRKMQRTVVNLTDPKTKASHVYEGVALDQLVPLKAFASEGESIEIQFGSHQITRIAGVDLESQTKLVVIDTIDGKQLSGYAPYYVVVKFRGKHPEAIAAVQCITIKSS